VMIRDFHGITCMFGPCWSKLQPSERYSIL
jgi:hypothetical protein